ncbi:MAG: YgjV family protein [Aquincola sp.]|nr:YgjV family protein [Aquincola sp.]
MEDWTPLLDAIQWPAMVATVAASWLVTSLTQRKRKLGFWLFLLSNLLWVVWGFHTQAWALLVLQFCLAAMNIRGARKNESGDA